MKPHKEHYKVFITKKYEMTRHGLMQFNPAFRRKVIPITFDGKVYRQTPYSTINNRDKLAEFTYERRGAGTYTICFWGKMKNKRYNPKHNCLKRRCKWYGHEQKPCRQYPRMKQGSSCKVNRKKIWNWNKRAELVIREGEEGIAYSYTFDKMKYMPFWRA